MTVAQRNTANLMIAAKGQAVTITRRTAGAYNTATSSATVTETTQTAKAVILPFPMGLRKQAGTTITAGDVQCLLAAGTLTAPEVDDTLTIASGLKYAITEVNALAPAGLTIFYDLTLRGHDG